ncbi:HlyD family efflux transporter periplasmic adaptor subunit [Ancylobacter sp. 6x-1]|uniref:HlyD family efflux transporter periplasmic adaptor subunit n=1 Tax=Ancylobacter crimeensis TaxID=2579147 RepID=A0ABT0DFR8_9HYPH|nr:HlyD family efflux transporter periplasmic adaptor subunit [Ancylobacter crimeensis]MCK0198800.1 HlyD family efflux transporter periplasmic adaptor subunit [Ancylobacter crimeensis]
MRRRLCPTRVAVLCAATLLLAACGKEGSPRFQGYAEGEVIFVGPDEAGRLTALSVDEGDRVSVGHPLFTVDDALQQADVTQAQASVGQAQGELANLKAAAQRPEEIAVLKAAEQRAASAVDLARIELARQRELTERKVGSQAALDNAQHSYDQNVAALDEARNRIVVGALPSRPEQIAAAEKAVEVATATLAAAKVRLERRARTAPAEGSIETVYFRPGELVPAGRPVVSILPPDLIKVRFFVSEPELPRFAHGTRVLASCDGCREKVPAKVSFIASAAEYTPPVIYSLDERAKLVFMLEARPDQPGTLRPGQPVTVELAP